MENFNHWIYLFFFLVALVYSSAGFGGGSLYLAILSQYNLLPQSVKFIALLCNSWVTAVGTINYQLRHHIPWKPLLLLLSCSLPLCIWASTFNLNTKAYFILLAFALIIAALFMLRKSQSATEDIAVKNPWWMYPLAAAIGFLSGLTGIGGGVYLAPAMHLSGWGSAKQIAGASAVFILLNSIAGLITQYNTNVIDFMSNQLFLILPVLFGGLIGSKLGSAFFSQKMVKYITIGLLIFAGSRILFKYI
jgi:uncharacterized protein